MKSYTKRSGFTLVELLIVLGILAMIGTLAVVSYSGAQASAKKKGAETLVINTREAIDMYNNAMSKYPETDEGLQALISSPDGEEEAASWKDGGGPFIKGGKLPKDPWGQELVYQKLTETDESGRGYLLYSKGPNQTDDSGADDDIPNTASEK